MSKSQQHAAFTTSGGSESALRIYAVVLSIGIVCSVSIVTTYQATRPIIQKNKLALRQRAIFDVLPEAETTAVFRLNEATGHFETTSPNAEGEGLVVAGFDQQGELAGLAIETQGMGYQDVITLVYGYSPDEEAIIGIRVLESRETPGLGDRIETDAGFLRNFERLDVHLNSEGTQLAHQIEFVKSGKKTADWQIDGITGATISSRAIAEMLRDSTDYWIPRIRSRVSDFRLPEQKE